MDANPQKQNQDLDNFLKAFAKTLSQTRLYSINHPLVKQSIQTCFNFLTAFLRGNNELTITFVDKMFLVNGTTPPGLTTISSTLSSIFEKYFLQSLTFLKNISNEEFLSFLNCLSSPKGRECDSVTSSPKETTDLKSALKKEKIEHIAINSAVYAKVGEGESIGEGSGDNSPSGQTIEKTKEWFDKLEELPLEDSLREIIQRSITDSSTQKKIYELILKQLQSEMEMYVQKATEGLQKEKRVLMSDQTKTKSVISQLSTGSVMVNEKGEVVMLTEGAEKILGASLAELKGKPLEQIAKQEIMISVADEIAPSQVEGTPKVRVHAQENTQQTIQNATAMVQNPEGKVVGMISILQDIAKLRELQRIQDDFMSHVTHELRSPLTAIKAALGAVSETASQEPQQEQVLNIANRNVDRLGRLINDLLDVSKIGAGKMTVNPKPVPSDALIREAVQSLESWAKLKQIQLLFESKGGSPYILADSDRTTQILVNLMSNAIKFTPPNGKINVYATMLGASYLKIFVRDSGQGMTQEEKDHLFERFYQAKQLTKSDTPGTGLGLYIAKTLVELQKGQIGVESEKGKGTTFYFTVPITAEPQKPAATPIQEEKPIKKRWLTRFFGKK